MEGKKPNKQPNKFIQLSSAGIQMGLTIYLGYILGVWLDGKYEKTFFEPSLTMIAIFASIYSLIKQVNKLNK